MPGTHADRLRRGLLAAIHIRAQALRLDEDTRRALQQRVGGHASCADMTVRQLRAVADELARAESRVGAPGLVDTTRPTERLDGMRRHARQLAADLGAGQAYLDAIAQQQSGVTLAEATAEQLRGVIGALWRHQQRQATRREQTRAMG